VKDPLEYGDPAVAPYGGTMWRRILLPGFLGFLTLLIWTFFTNGVLRISSQVTMNRIPDETAVYELLKETVRDPGGYTVNPAPVPGAGFPFDEPVFRVLYSGFGHEAAGRLVFTDAAIGLVASLLVAVLLSMTSDRVRSRASLTALFAVGVGLFAAVSGDLPKYGIGGYPAKSVLLLGASTLVAWTLTGIVIARTMPAPAAPDSA
jgi:hypothetical protein